MRNSTLLLAIASAMFMQAAPAAAQNNVPIRKIKAVKPTTELTLLDRVESDTHRKIYQNYFIIQNRHFQQILFNNSTQN